MKLQSHFWELDFIDFRALKKIEKSPGRYQLANLAFTSPFSSQIIFLLQFRCINVFHLEDEEEVQDREVEVQEIEAGN